MNYLDTQKQIKSLIEVQVELVDLVEQCFDKMYPDEKGAMKAGLHECLDYFENWGCLSLFNIEGAAGVRKKEDKSNVS